MSNNNSNTVSVPSTSSTNSHDIINEKIYTLTIDAKKYPLVVQYLRDGTIYYLVGNSKKPRACFDLIYNIETSHEFPAFFELHGLGTDNECEMDGLMERGDSRKMGQAILHWVVTTQKHDISEILLTDTSQFPCPSGQRRQHIPLAAYHFLIHGKTWYEKIFGAVQPNHNIARKIDIMRLKIKESIGLSLIDFWLKCFNNSDGIERIESKYSAEMSWQEAFQLVLNEFGCIIFLGKLSTIYETIGIQESHLTENVWICPTYTILTYDIDYTIKLATEGGSRHKTKKSKLKKRTHLLLQHRYHIPRNWS